MLRYVFGEDGQPFPPAQGLVIVITAHLLFAITLLALTTVLLLGSRRRTWPHPYSRLKNLFLLCLVMTALDEGFSALLFFWPAYVMGICLKVIAASVAVVASFSFAPYVKQLLAFHSPEEMQLVLSNAEDVQRELRHKSRDLEQQVMLRNALEQKVSCLQEMRSQQVRHEDDVHRILTRLEATTDQITIMMREMGGVPA